mgnify:FL=1
MIDILALDDPLLAFRNDLDFTAIGYDYMVLVSPEDSDEIDTLDDLRNLKFVQVKGSAQRLAFQTLEQTRIPYTIDREVKSQFDWHCESLLL